MKVSVLMITYNHESFVAQAVQSALDQVTDFPYEIVIGEDRSTDRTREVLVELQAAHPDKIRLLLRDHNVGMNVNLIQTLGSCQGEYIALLEGDDYWTSPAKLQRQVDFLDNHPECASCFHNVEVFEQSGASKDYQYCPPEQKQFSDLRDLLAANFVPSCSTMFRREALGVVPLWFYGLRMGDWPLHIFCAQHGLFGYIPLGMGRYRLHTGGVWSATSLIGRYQSTIAMFQYLRSYLGPEYEDAVNATLALLWQKLGDRLIDMGVEQAAREGSVASVHRAFETWPGDAAFQGDWKRDILCQLYSRLLFASHADHDRRQVRRWLVGLLRCDFSCFANRGVRSIAVEAAFGPALANGLRRGLGRVI